MQIYLLCNDCQFKFKLPRFAHRSYKKGVTMYCPRCFKHNLGKVDKEY